MVNGRPRHPQSQTQRMKCIVDQKPAEYKMLKTTKPKLKLFILGQNIASKVLNSKNILGTIKEFPPELHIRWYSFKL